jgi:hypothetical protein
VDSGAGRKHITAHVLNENLVHVALTLVLQKLLKEVFCHIRTHFPEMLSYRVSKRNFDFLNNIPNLNF